MTVAYVVETASQTAGVAVREENGFRFYAADRSFIGLDQRVFPRLKELHRAVEEAAENGVSPRRRTSG